MQNTSRIQSIPNTLIKNFFISGVSQGTLASKIAERYSVNIQPEILFSMYSPKEIAACYLQFVFPENIEIQYKPIEPKFYTFMSTDGSGFNSFFHCLIFYEEINEAELAYDFDVKKVLYEAHQTRKKNEKLSKYAKKRKSGKGEDAQAMFEAQAKMMRRKQLQRKESNMFLNATDLRHHMKQEEKIDLSYIATDYSPMTPINNKKQGGLTLKQQQELKAQQTAQQMKNMMSNIQGVNGSGTKPSQQDPRSAYQSFHKVLVTSGKDKIDPSPVQKSWLGPTTQQIQERQRKVPDRNKNSEKTLNSFKLDPQFSSPMTNKLQNMEFSEAARFGASPKRSNENEDASVNFTNSTMQYMGLMSPLSKGSLGQQPQNNLQNQAQQNEILIDYASPDKTRVLNKDQPTDSGSKKANNDFQLSMSTGIYKNFKESAEAPNQLGTSNYERQINKLYQAKLYIPVAFVIETETEFHDDFREMLISLFELIRTPDKVVADNLYENKLASFAELISHLSFLKTIPAPSFNSIYNIQFLNQTITLKENPFTEIPNKNQNAIKILFDCLDVRSILYCWKALLCDKTLVLVSSQFSLQFYVAEALKQLLFPLTWQNSYIQPGSEKLKGLCDGTITMIYTTPGYSGDFDFFDGISPNVAVCDIDACYTNSIAMPCIHDEQMYIRILNIMKNNRVNQYDMAYPHLEPINNDDFVQEVRKTFFKLLQPYLINLEDFIDKTADPQTASFDKYFLKKKYLESFDDHEVQQKFATDLIESSQFVHFCDDYYSEELNNFQMFQAILRARGDISTLPQKITLFEKSPKHQKSLNEVEDTPIVFHFRMPQTNHQIMLYEKIEYMILDALRKREEDLSRASDKEAMMDDDKSYEQIIKDIKMLYGMKQELKNRSIEQLASPAKPNVRNAADTKGLLEINRTEEFKQDGQSYKIVHNHSRNSSQSQARVNIQGANDLQSNGVEHKPMFPYQLQDRTIRRQKTLGTSSFVSDKASDQVSGQNQQTVDKNSTVTSFLHSSTQPRFVQKHSAVDYSKNQNSNINTTTNRPIGKSQFQDFQQSRDEVSQSFIQHSQYLNDSLDEEDQERIQHLQAKVVRLIYGKQGLLNILSHIYDHLNDSQRKRVNYYFSLREQLKSMEVKKPNRLMSPATSTIYEDPCREDEQTPKNYMRTPMKTISSSSLGNNQRQAQFNQAVQRNASGMLQLKSTSIFQIQSQWFKVEGQEERYKKLKRTYQFILTKAKIYESFECLEAGYSLVFFELIKFPQTAMEFFPLNKCETIWGSLTKSQKNQIHQKYGLKKPLKEGLRKQNECIRLIFEGFTQNNSPNKTRFETMGSTNGMSPQKLSYADERLFQQASLDSPYFKNRTNSGSSHSVRNNISPPTTKKGVEKRESTQKLIASQQTMVLKNVKDSIKSRLGQTIKNRNTTNQVNSGDMTMIMHKQPKDDSSLFEDVKAVTVRLEKQGSVPDMNKGWSSHYDANTPNYDLSGKYLKRDPKIAVLNNAEEKSAKLLEIMIEFWKRNYKFVEKGGKFQSQELDRIKEELEVFESYFKSFKRKSPDFKNNDISQQVFFLNIHNFLVLHKMAMLMFSEPEAVEKLKNYNMWQHLLCNTTIIIAGIKISAYYIQHAILRLRLSKPDISNFQLDLDYVDNSFFQVKEPNKLISFGIFLPLNGQPELHVYRMDTYESQLKSAAAELLKRKIKFKNGNKLIQVPMIVYWYNKDFGGDGMQELLDFFYNKVFETRDELRSNFRKVLKMITQDHTKMKQYLIEYQCYGWAFNPLRMAHYFDKQ